MDCARTVRQVWDVCQLASHENPRDSIGAQYGVNDDFDTVLQRRHSS